MTLQDVVFVFAPLSSFFDSIPTEAKSKFSLVSFASPIKRQLAFYYFFQMPITEIAACFVLLLSVLCERVET